MDCVPFTFVDSVAHLLPDNNLYELCDVGYGLWSKVCNRHFEKRKHYEFELMVNDEAVLAERLEEFAKLINPFARISQIRIFSGYGYDFPCQKTQLERVLDSFPRQIIKAVWFPMSLQPRETLFLRFLWKRPIRTISFSALSITDEFVDYHLLENHSLQLVRVHHASYGFMCKLIKTWTDELKQELWHESDTEEKSFFNIRDLGFEEDEWQMGLQYSAVSKSGREVTFYATQ
ncbi:hypothetical protein L596_009898 [Steinernema carpocapsae]|uniref:Uncharacterized protein n=1 Tax=Steinernema carpocapsae TaxID=34508 RepID=A0A4U5PI04_STECR|nr:hypothetical protein L596_009898 [Steinernema carpocapsae]